MSSWLLTAGGLATLLADTGNLIVGDAGVSSLSINAGGTVTTSGDAVIAATGSASNSSVQVTGAGSNWQVAGTLVVGDAGFGSLSISQGGSVHAASLSEAALASGDGVITVAGTGSILNLSGSLTVGSEAAGELSILSGATVTALTATVGNGSPASSGNVDVEGTGSELDIAGNLNIGAAGGSGILTIGTGTTLRVGGTIVETGHASFNNNGGVVDPDAVQFTSASNSGSGLNLYDFYVENRGAVQIADGTGTWDTPMLLTGTSVADAATNRNNGRRGQWQLSSGGTLVINSNTVDAGQVIVFEDNTATLVIGQLVNGGKAGISGQTPTVFAGAENLLQAGGFQAAIWGYEAGDQILFNNLAVVGDRIVNGNTLELLGVGNVDLGSLTFRSRFGDAPLDAATMAAAAVQMTSRVIQIDNATTLMSVGNEYVLKGSGGSGPILQYGGQPVTVGEFGAYTPIGATLTAGGYEVALKNTTTGLVTVWNTDARGAFTGSPTGGPVPGTSPVLEELELSFNQDLNSDGTIGLKATPLIQIDNATTLISVGNEYVLEGAAGTGPILQYGGNPVTVGQFGAYTPIGAAALTAGGYEVALKNTTTGLVTVWNTDARGAFTGSPTGGPVPGTSPVLEELELSFNQDLNSDGTIGLKATPLIQIDNTTTLISVGNEYVLEGSGGTGPILQYGGNPVTVGQFGAYTPIGAAALTAGGYEVALKNTTTGLVTVWNTDARGAFAGSPSGGPVPGTSPVLEELELSFNQDLNSDGMIGLKATPLIQIDNTTTLISVGNEYVLEGSGGTGPILQYGGNPVTVGQFGAYTPIGAAALTAGGYEVALKNTTTGLVTVWNTDARGAFARSPSGGPVPGTSPVLEELELSFNQDLNSDGMIGLKATPLIQIDNTTTLISVGNEYVLEGSGGTGPILQYGGNPVTAGEFGAYTPIGAAALTAGGYEVALKNATTGLVTVWNTDARGAFTGSPTGGPVAGTSPVLEELELSFNQDLNSDGTIGLKATPLIQIDNATTLISVGNEYVLEGSGGTGPILQYGGNPVTVGQFGAYAPIGAAALTGGGYEVALKNTTTGLVTVWNTDAHGAFTGSPTGGPVAGTSPVLEELELSFNQDLNSDGTIGLKATPLIQIDNATTLISVGNEYVLEGSGGTGPILQYGGNPVTVGEFGAYTPIGAAALTAGGYEVALKNTTTGLVTVWNTDAHGAFTGSPTGGPVAGTSPVLEELELSFNQDLNSDGTIGLKATPLIQIDNATTLISVGNEYVLEGAAGTGPILQFGGNPVTVGEFGGWAPIGSVAHSGGGYLVAWKVAGQDQYVVWNTDSNGNYTGGATGVVSGEDFSLEDLEPTFGQSLNGEGTVSTNLVTTTGTGGVLNLTGQTQATIINLGDNTARASAGLNAVSLSFIGTPDAITLGSGGATIEYTLAQSSGIETIANFVYGLDELNIDLRGAASGLLQAYDTTVGGVPAIAIASSTDPTRGVVLLSMTTGQTAANLLASHTTFVGGHALIS